MKLTEISYRRLFSTGAYENQSIELTASLSENEDTLNAYTQLHKMAEELHYSKNAEMYAQQGTQVRDIEPVDKIQQQKEQEERIRSEYEEVERQLNSIEFQEDAIEYLNTTTFKHFIPAKQIANSKPIKNK